MHTINSLKNALGLATTNQVRNRIEAIRDVLEGHIRRGPNNQILLSDEGVEWLRRLQELHDSGLRMEEASGVIRSNAQRVGIGAPRLSRNSGQKPMDPGDRDALIEALRDEIGYLRRLIGDLEARLQTTEPPQAPAWWESLKGEIDVP